MKFAVFAVVALASMVHADPAADAKAAPGDTVSKGTTRSETAEVRNLQPITRVRVQEQLQRIHETQPIIEETVIQPIVERTRTYQVQQRTSVRPAMVRENVATAPKKFGGAAAY